MKVQRIKSHSKCHLMSFQQLVRENEVILDIRQLVHKANLAEVFQKKENKRGKQL